MLRFLRAARLPLLSLLIAHCSLLIAQAQAPKTYSSSEILLGLKKLNVVGSVMYIAAHPDDENTRLLAYLANGRQLETSYLSCTRGDGGQDLIGPELREQLGVIRTQELLAARRIDGAHQYFTRANDFGFSKTSAETFTIWDKEQVLSDMVWVIRQRRPDVLITRFPPDARAGHGHHQASAILAAEAFDAAGDPKRFPEQLKYVQAWQPKRLYWNTGSFFVKPGENMDGYLKLDAGGYNPLLGQSYGEIAAHSRSQHRSQGFGSAAQRGEAIEYFQFVKGTPAKTDLFEGIDQTWNRVPGGAAVGKQIQEVIKTYDAANPSASVAGLEKALLGLATLTIGAKDHFWFNEKINAISVLMQACAGIYAEATVGEPTLASGGEITVTYDIVNRSGLPIKLEKVRLTNAHFTGDPTRITLDDEAPDNKQAVELGMGKRATGTLPLTGFRNALISQPYWLREPGSVGMYKFSEPESDYAITKNFVRGQPENAPVATATFSYAIGEKRFNSITVPVQYKHTDPVLGELYPAAGRGAASNGEYPRRPRLRLCRPAAQASARDAARRPGRGSRVAGVAGAQRLAG